VPIEFIGQNPPIPFWDLGWRLAVLDMSPYAGQTVRLELSNYNRIDNRFNTWTDVYAVRLRDWPWQQRLYLPAVGAPGRGPVEPDGICYPYGLNGSLQGAESSDEGRWRSELAPLGPEDSGP